MPNLLSQIRALALIASALFLFLSSSCLAIAQDAGCQSLQVEQSDPLHYQNRGNRCEGLYRQEVGARALTLLSLNIGEISYSLSAGTHVSVTAPTQRTDKAYVRALPRSPSISYEMDSVLARGKTLDWPVSDVLLPEQLSADQIGIFAWEVRDGQNIFLPVLVRLSREAITQSNNVTITIRPSFDVQIFKWRWAPLNGNACAASGPWQDAITEPVSASEAIRIRFPQVSGIRCIDLAAQGSDSAWKTQDLQVEFP